jgi:hypothetical protein
MPKNTTTRKLDKETLQEIVLFVKDTIREEERSNASARHKRKIANTKILLRNFRSLRKHCENAVYDADTIDEGGGYTFADILELINGPTIANLKVESIRQSAVRTRIIVDHIEIMLDLFHAYCDNSPKEEDKRRYRVIQGLFLDDRPKTYIELAEEEYVGKSTIYNDVDIAVERLTALIFGIDGLDFLVRESSATGKSRESK